MDCFVFWFVGFDRFWCIIVHSVAFWRVLLAVLGLLWVLAGSGGVSVQCVLVGSGVLVGSDGF
jgi:hypothetical protein